MLSHKIRLPDGTEIEFFASDEALFKEKFGNLLPTYQHLDVMAKYKKPKDKKQVRKCQKQARRKQR